MTTSDDAVLRLKLTIPVPSVIQQKLIEHTEQGDSALISPEQSEKFR